MICCSQSLSPHVGSCVQLETLLARIERVGWEFMIAVSVKINSILWEKVVRKVGEQSLL